jgi:hypothetical protein
MSEPSVYPVPPEVADRCFINASSTRPCIAAPWRTRKASGQSRPTSSSTGTASGIRSSAGHAAGRVSWFAGGRLNISTTASIVTCRSGPPDRHHLGGRRSRPAPHHHLPDAARRGLPAGQRLKSRGVGRGDRVCIYMPMIPEAAYAMLACMRIGAIHSVVFGGFSPHSLRDRILDADCRCVITADEGVRGGRRVPLKANTEAALDRMPGRAHGDHRATYRRRRCLAGPSGTSGITISSPISRHLHAGIHGGRGPIVHPLHVRLHRQTEGRPARHRRLPAARGHDPQVRLRLSRRRRLLVHGRRRLGHRSLVHRLRAAGQRRRHPDVRRRTDLSGRSSLLAGGRQAPASTSSTPPPPRCAR